MDLVVAGFVAFSAVLAAASARIISEEFKAWTPWMVERLIRYAERDLPEELRKRLGEEWRSHVTEVPGDLSKLIVACGFIRAAKKLSGHAGVDRVVGVVGFFTLLPLLIVFGVLLAIEQRRFPFVRSKQIMWGRAATIWKFRTLRDDGSRISRLVRRANMETVPSLLDMALGHLQVPDWNKLIKDIARFYFGKREEGSD